MRRIAIAASSLLLAGGLMAAELQAIKLNEPNKKRGLPFMETLSVKASARAWSEKKLSLQDLSDLLWAANGINRPEEEKSTASSAMNARDIVVYVFMGEGVFRYEPLTHELQPVLAGDFRAQIMMVRPPRPAGAPPAPGAPGTPPPAAAGTPPPPPPPSHPPVQLVLVSDSARFRMGPPELRREWGTLDAGIVSQNISLFCAATGLKTRPRASMDKEKIKGLLQLTDAQHVLLNHPVGYAQ